MSCQALDRYLIVKWQSLRFDIMFLFNERLTTIPTILLMETHGVIGGWVDNTEWDPVAVDTSAKMLALPTIFVWAFFSLQG